MEKHALHYFRETYGCPVHWLGYLNREQRCSCRIYWKRQDEVSEKAWREDHSMHECQDNRGACAFHFELALISSYE